MDDRQHFKDRREQIEVFDRFWGQNKDWILPFTGFSGLGKTTLLDWLKVNRCQEANIIVIPLDLANSDEDIGSLFLHFLYPLRPFLSPIAFTNFDEGRRATLQRLEQVPINVNISQTVLYSKEINQSLVANLHQFYRDYEKQAERDYADQFVAALHEVRQSGRIICLVDNYDTFQRQAACETIDLVWTTLERGRHILPKLSIVLASREDLWYVNEIQSLRRGLFKNDSRELQPFSPEDSDALLKDLGAADPEYRLAIYQRLAHGHPFVTRMAAEAWMHTPGGISISDIPKLLDQQEAVAWLQKRILNGLSEHMRSIVEVSLMLREFDADILSALADLPNAEIQENFRKLIALSFVRPSGNAWTCHPLARQVQIQYRRREGPQTFKDFHQKAMQYYQAREQAAESFYHGFLCQPEKTFIDWYQAVVNVGSSYHHADWLDLIEIAMAPELQLPPKLNCEILYQDGQRFYYLSRMLEARERYEEAQPIYHEIGERLGEANCIKSLGDVHLQLAEYRQARERYAEAQPIYHEIGSRLSEANCIRSLGDVHLQLAEYYQARERYAEAQSIYHEIGDRLGEANCIKSLGDVHLRVGEYRQARERYEEAQLIYHEIGQKLGEANCIQALGNVALEQEDWRVAEARYLEALNMAVLLDLINIQASVLNSLANLYLRQKNYQKAIEIYSQAIGSFPKEAMYYRNRASVFIALRQVASAGEDLQVAKKLQPEHPYLFLRLGDLAVISDRYLEAMSFFQAALNLVPRLSGAWFGIGRATLLQGDDPPAEQAYRRGLDLTDAPNELLDEIEELERLYLEYPQRAEMIDRILQLLHDYRIQPAN